MRIFFSSIAIATILLAVWATAAAAGAPFQLNVGQSTKLGDLTVGFEKVSNDGRCPTSIVCVWEGNAACEMWVELPGSSPVEFTLNTTAMFGQSFTHEGNTIRLLLLEPYPAFLAPIPQESYVATLMVSATTTDGDLSTWGRVKALYAR